MPSKSWALAHGRSRQWSFGFLDCAPRAEQGKENMIQSTVLLPKFGVKKILEPHKFPHKWSNHCLTNGDVSVSILLLLYFVFWTLILTKCHKNYEVPKKHRLGHWNHLFAATAHQGLGGLNRLERERADALFVWENLRLFFGFGIWDTYTSFVLLASSEFDNFRASAVCLHNGLSINILIQDHSAASATQRQSAHVWKNFRFVSSTTSSKRLLPDLQPCWICEPLNCTWPVRLVHREGVYWIWDMSCMHTYVYFVVRVWQFSGLCDMFVLYNGLSTNILIQGRSATIITTKHTCLEKLSFCFFDYWYVIEAIASQRLSRIGIRSITRRQNAIYSCAWTKLKAFLNL